MNSLDMPVPLNFLEIFNGIFVSPDNKNIKLNRRQERFHLLQFQSIRNTQSMTNLMRIGIVL